MMNKACRHAQHSGDSGSGPGVVAFAVLAVAATLALWVAASSLEARAFNHVTSREVSTWDAMFLDLRVVGEAP